MKKILSLILALVMVVGLLPVTPAAHAEEAAPVQNELAGKTIACIGNSITAGVGVTKDQTDYVTLLAKSLEMDYIRLGASGTTLCTGGHATCNINKLTEANLAGADVVTILMGINDFVQARGNYYRLGTVDSTDTSTIYGAVHMWCQQIEELRQKDSLKDTEFYFMTPVITSWNNSVSSVRNWDQSKMNIHGYTLRDLCNAIIEVCALYDVPVIDLNLISGLYYNSAEDNTIAEFGGDGAHPGTVGHQMMADAIENALLNNHLLDDHDHSYGSWITTTYPDCEGGEQHRVCSVCTATETRNLAGNGHHYESGICTACGKEAPNPEDFEGKSVSILSHSMSTYAGVSNNTSYNSTIGNNDVYYTAGKFGVYQKDTWWQQAIDALGMKLLVNNSWSGSCVFMPRKGEASVGYGDRAVNLHNDRTGEDPEVIWVYLGCNDFAYYKDTFGKAEDIDYDALIRDNGDETFTYATPTTTCEAYAIMLHKAEHRYPDAEIYCMTSTARRDPDYPDNYADTGQPTAYSAELHRVAEHFGFPVIDLEGCIPKEAELFDQYIGDKRAHANPLGMDQITNAVLSVMLGETAEIRHVTSENGVVKEQAVLLGGSYSAEVEIQDGYSVVVTMGGNDVTEEVYQDGSITIAEVTGDIAVSAVITRDPMNFRWEFKDGELTSVGETENTLLEISATVENGILNDGRYELTIPAALKHDRPWSVEWKCAENWRGVLLSSDPAPTKGMTFLSRVNGGQLCFGTWTGTQYNNYGIDVSDLDDQVHTYRLENRIAADGSNMVWLYLDGVEIGPMIHYFIGSKDQSAISDWASGKDFIFSYIGIENHALRSCRLDYLEVTECEHVYENGVCTAPTCTEQGYTTYTCTACGDSYVADYVDATGHSFGTWEHISVPTASAPGIDQRICTSCGETETCEVEGSWQKYALADHLQELPAQFCAGTNLWTLLEPEPVMINHLGEWVIAGSTVYSVTILISPGDKIYANSFVEKGIQVSFFDDYSIIKTLFSADTRKEFNKNGGYLIAPEGAIAVNIPVWNINDENNTLSILNYEHVNGVFTVAPTCTTDGYTKEGCKFCDQGTVSDIVPAYGHTVVTQPKVEATCTTDGLTEGSYCSTCSQVLVQQTVIPAGHNIQVLPSVLPSVEETGLTSGLKCTACNTVFVAQKETPAVKRLSDYLRGKRVSILGDSISTYLGVSNNAESNTYTVNNVAGYRDGGYYTNDNVTSVDLTWWMQSINAFDMELLVNHASGSGTLLTKAGNGTLPAYYDEKCLNLHDNAGENAGLLPEIIAVYIGVNDSSRNQPAGALEDIDFDALIQENADGSFTYAVPGTMAEGFAVMLHKMQNAYPGAEIYLFTIPRAKEPAITYADTIKEVAEYYGVGVVDLYNSALTQSGSSAYFYDGVHPNAEGMEIISGLFQEALLKQAMEYHLEDGHSYENGICTVCGAEHPNLANFEGKVISILGDSISTFAGYIPVADGFNLEHLARYPQDNLLTDVNETWWMQVITALGGKLGINDSWRGATVSGAVPVTTGTTGENAAMGNLTRIQNLGANGTPDVILFYGGTNDLAHVSKVGSFDPNTAPTTVDLTTKKWDNLAEAYVHTLLRLRHFYPDTQIVCLLPTYTTSYYSNTKLAQANEVLAQICKHYGAAYIDLRECGITIGDLPDGIHPDAAGMDFITGATVETLLDECEMEAGENVVHSVTHTLTGAKSSLSYYKGVTHGKAFVTAITGEEVTVSVTMGGVDITSAVYADGVITIVEVTGDVVITAQGHVKAIYEDHLQQLPDEVCAGINLWNVLEHDPEYYTVSGWDVHTSGKVYSVTFPVSAGDRIYATSFGAAGSNGQASVNGIRTTFFDADGLLISMSPEKVYDEFAVNGFLTVPEGAVAVNVPMWRVSDENELYILNRDHIYEDGICTACGAMIADMTAMEVSFDAEILMWTYFVIPDELLNDDNAKVLVTKNGAWGETTTEITMAELRANGPTSYGDYKVEQGIASGEMTREVTVRIVDGNGNYVSIRDYVSGNVDTKVVRTAADYAARVFEVGSARQKELVKAMLTYGGYSQKHFNVDAGNPVYNLLTEYGYEIPALEDITADDIEQEMSKSAVDNGVTYSPQEAYLDSAIYHRVYFKLDAGEEISNFKFEIELIDVYGNLYTETVTATYDSVYDEYYVDIPDIAAAHLDYLYTVTVTNLTTGDTYEVTTSVLVWAKTVIARSSNVNQVNLAKAVYYYNQAANVFFGK